LGSTQIKEKVSVVMNVKVLSFSILCFFFFRKSQEQNPSVLESPVSETGTTNKSFSGDEETTSVNDNKEATSNGKVKGSERAAVIIQTVTSL